ncbi:MULTISPECIES: response regulator [Brevibacillus]|jgi:two-component system chemotaxis response regulator CheY|uniref:Response regulator n=1 Tax=Brevibacillus nitrificans TaxID=651560 RepID=A0A3M8CW52_9BACL|nr:MULTISPECIES: response regulator [Brevibacillus]MEC2127524.1 response regulator [Brevibacillus centrosporus]MED1795518.1 response regulator [Brevibacillus nitrificans]MED1952058.1 response regulator [Brevibacillus centrosporus]MED4910509.1 response regulator [Brevibacillus centrosporus]RNB67851.1 response regulator [Brevibacillus centrosporus]
MARILIADDSIVVREYLKVTLERAGHQIVAEATRGTEAFQKYIAYKPDLVTMDINMPEMNGIETVKMIINRFPDAKIIMVSSHGLKPLVFEAVSAGATHYIIKPINEEKLLVTIENALI